MERGTGENMNRWFKFGDVRTQDGRIYGRQIVTRIDITPTPFPESLSGARKPRQVTVEELKELLDGGPPIVRATEGQRPREDMRIEIGPNQNQWTRQEVEEIIAAHEGKKEDKPKRGRPPKESKDDESTDSGDGPAGARSTRSKGDES